MKLISTAAFFLFLFVGFVIPVFARSGCCSWHGGVCGCGCCDGTPLSDTCAPYYPQCSQPTYTAPTAAPTYNPTPIPTVVSTPVPTTNVVYSIPLSF